MAKMRVYDLAKELGIESKQIIETLNTTEYAVKAASSNIDDPAQDIVRKKFGKSAAAENTASDARNSFPMKCPSISLSEYSYIGT